MKAVRWLAVILAVILIGAVMIGVLTRFQDGPTMAFPGGPFVSGEVVPSQGVDWSFLRDVDVVELELIEPPQSRTTWILYHEGAIFIPCGIPNFTLWKQWPHQAMKDGRGRLRFDDKIYDVQLVRIERDARFDKVTRVLGEKYGLWPADGDNVVWIFRLDARG